MAKKILVTEDESIVRKDIERCLEQLGYEVVASVDTGEKGYRASARAQARPVPYGHYDQRRYEWNCRR